MTQKVIHRPARARMPEPALRTIELHPAPATAGRGGSGGTSPVQLLMPLLGGAGSMIMLITNKNPVMLIAGGLMLSVTVLGGMVMFVVGKTGKAKLAVQQRRRYLEYLERTRAEIVGIAEVQRAHALLQHPAPVELVEVARSPVRIWERRPGDADFMTVRVGTGSSPVWQQIVPPRSGDPLSDPDVVVAAAVHRLVNRDRMVHGMPAAVPISGQVSVIGPQPLVQQTATALLAQLVTWHGPEDLRLYAYSPRQAALWLDWLKWLPHHLSTSEVDGTAPRRQFATTPEELGGMLRVEISRRAHEVTRSRRRADPSFLGPALVVVIDNPGGRPVDPLQGLPPDLHPSAIGVHVITLAQSPQEEPGRVDVRVRCADGGMVTDLPDMPAHLDIPVAPQVVIEDYREEPFDDPMQPARHRAKGAKGGAADAISPAELSALVRELTALRLVEEKVHAAPLETTLGLEDYLGVPDVGDFDPATTWLPRTLPNFLRVPFGIGAAGELVYLDLKEPALGGMGPHGLCVGATGSGKSEVLRTVVLTQAIAHPAERLALVLVDYKGGATFAGLEDLPHCAAMISNLSDDDGLVDRLHDAMFGEMKRRQQVLADAGNLPNITEYNRRRDLGEPLAPLPNLFVVIDEFGELLTAKPDFIELFLAIGRIGRSIGVHLLLASQRLEEGKLRGLESFLSYRLGLRTFNAGESRTVLGVPDAYELPPIPGSGYLKVDTTVFQRFKAAYVSGSYIPPETGVTEIDTDPVVAPFPLFNDIGRYLAARDTGSTRKTTGTDAPEEAIIPSVLETAVARLAAAGRQVDQIWLPPLPTTMTLDRVTGEPRQDPQDGLTLGSRSGSGQRSDPHAFDPRSLLVPVGLLDKPAQQQQGPLVLDLGISGGHLAVLGAPQSGKSTFVRTLITSAALHFRPGEIAFYCVDLGGSLRSLTDLPHVAGVAPRLDPERIRRSVAEVRAMLVEREELFAKIGIDAVETMRERFHRGALPELAVADVFLVIDNYGVLKSDFDDLTESLQDIATRGPGYGIHLLLTSGRWADLRMQLQAAIGIKLEFRLNDPADSIVDRKVSRNLRANTQGRCIVAGGLMGQICQPWFDRDAAAAAAVPDSETGAGAGPLEQLVTRIATAWTGPPVPRLRTLPALIPFDELMVQSRDTAGTGVPIGLDEAELKPVRWDCFGSEHHLLVIGDSESGKTSFLRGMCADLVSRYTDNEVVFAVFDVRRSLLDVIPEDYLGAYVGTTAGAPGVAGAIAGELAKRMPADDVTAAELRSRSWWQGPEIFVIADDYDLLNPAGPGPLAPFAPFLAQARDIGFHMVLARRSGGAGRAMHEPVIQRLKESGATGLLLSGDRQEGALFPNAALTQQPPGRGLLVRRGRKPALIQLAYRDDVPIPMPPPHPPEA